MRPRPKGKGYRRTSALAIAGALVLALPVAALLSDTNIEDLIVEGEVIKDVTIRDSNTDRVRISNAAISGSSATDAFIQDVSVHDSYLDRLSLRDAYLEGSRITHADAEDVTFKDTTVCNATINEDFGFGNCELVDIESGEKQTWAHLDKDAPATISPGGSYDLPISTSASHMTIGNDPGGLVGLGFDPDVDPLGLKSLGFTATAGNDSVDRFELWSDGEKMSEFGMGETVELPEGDFTVRVHTASAGIIDHSQLALVIDLDGHGLRPAATAFDVVATDLVIPPVESQLFAPFLADDVARLVLSVPIDGDGNVDRDVDIAFAVTVTDVHSGEDTLVSDMNDRANLHDDSRLFSPAPFSYRPTVDAAHHPQTLELLVRENLVAGLSHGAIDAYGTHLIVMGPYETDLTLSASGTNAHGALLEAELALTAGALPEEERTATFFGKDFALPGTGTLDVAFVDSTGAPVEAGAGWSLFMEETPESHGVKQAVAIDEGATSATQDLAASKQLTTPLGNFLPSEYQVCVDHDGTRDCHEGLVAIETGKTTSLEIVMG